MGKNTVALYSGIQEIAVKDVERESAPPGFVLMETRCSGICGSDLHSYFGHWKQTPDHASGHEAAGTIVEVGQGVTGFSEGDRATFECFSHCGDCVYCRIGQYNHCVNPGWASQVGHGGFAHYSTIHESSLFTLPDTISFEQGALIEPLAVGYRAFARSGAGSRDRVAIIGGGTIGLCCLAAAVAGGVRETIIAVKYEQQESVARDFGADHIVDVGNVDLRDYVKDMTDGLGVDAVIETVGAHGTFDDALAMVRRQGSVVLLAGYAQPQEVDLGRVVSCEACITGSNCYSMSGLKTDFQASVDLIESGAVDITKLVTHRFPLEEIAEGFRIAADKQSGSIKVHICQ